MIAQLTTLDAGLRRAQEPDWDASLAIGAVAVINGAVPDFELLKTTLAQRLRSIPRHAQVLRTQWIDQPEFDFDAHIQRAALPGPGDEAELFRAIAHALERPLDLDRPLWECWVIEGLEHNRWAILLKLHHSMADGISAVQILTRLCDDADHTGANHVAVKPVPDSDAGARSWPDSLATNIVKAAARAVSWPTMWLSSADSPITMRHYTAVRFALADVDRVCRKFGVTANDVALAAISEGFRTMLLHRGEQPRADSLRTLEKPANQISALLPYLPVDQNDPITRLRTVHSQLNPAPAAVRTKSASLADYTPLALCTKAIQTLVRLPQRSVVTLATDAPAPRHRLQLMGQSMEQVLPIPPTALQLSTGVAVLCYDDELVFGITADYQAATDLRQLAAGIERGMAQLVALSQDSVLLFGKDRRKRRHRSRPGGVAGRTLVSPARVRR